MTVQLPVNTGSGGDTCDSLDVARVCPAVGHALEFNSHAEAQRGWRNPTMVFGDGTFRSPRWRSHDGILVAL
jgi:hypothetical protein